MQSWEPFRPDTCPPPPSVSPLATENCGLDLGLEGLCVRGGGGRKRVEGIDGQNKVPKKSWFTKYHGMDTNRGWAQSERYVASLKPVQGVAIPTHVGGGREKIGCVNVTTL